MSIVAAAIFTAPVGWLAARFGKKNFFIATLIGFTVASMLCGIAETLPQMVFFRALQGMSAGVGMAVGRDLAGGKVVAAARP